MNSDLIVALLSCIGTAAGAITGIIVSNRLSTYRIEQLEKKLDKYANNVDAIREKLIIVEQSVKSAHHRLDDITKQFDLKDSRKDR